ncbi:hypothetical protein WA158_007369 [Blastocystis sp. Blastoise]
MRPLTDEETKIFFEKLTKYIGNNVDQLINRPDDPHCFRLHKDRVYYISENVLRVAGNVARGNIVSIGTKFGKFNHNLKFRLHVTCLDILAQYAVNKVWVKPSAEMTFLYGNHITKGGLARITEDTQQYAGCIIYNMNNVPLGFGITSHTTEEIRVLDAASLVVLHQADIGEYLRDETILA